MSMNCDIILQWRATPEQLAALGAALWRWCTRAAGATGIYQHLDNQALADLIAGKLPETSQTPWRADRRGVHFWVQGEVSQNRQATIGSLRREIPAEGVEDIVVDGKSWNLTD
jgi:transposase